MDNDAADLDAAAKLDAEHRDAAMWRETHGAAPDMAVSQATPPVSQAADDALCASFAELFRALRMLITREARDMGNITTPFRDDGCEAVQTRPVLTPSMRAEMGARNVRMLRDFRNGDGVAVIAGREGVALATVERVLRLALNN